MIILHKQMREALVLITVILMLMILLVGLLSYSFYHRVVVGNQIYEQTMENYHHLQDIEKQFADIGGARH